MHRKPIFVGNLLVSFRTTLQACVSGISIEAIQVKRTVKWNRTKQHSQKEIITGIHAKRLQRSAESFRLKYHLPEN